MELKLNTGNIKNDFKGSVDISAIDVESIDVQDPDIPTFNVQDANKINDFLDSPLPEEKQEEEAKQGKNFIAGLINFIKGENFEKTIVEEAQRTGFTKKQVANSFFQKILGTLSDILNRSIEIVHDVLTTTVSLLASVLIKTSDIIVRCFKRLVSALTLNLTCCEG